jgi:uncharacterized protein (TIGR03067 family)
MFRLASGFVVLLLGLLATGCNTDSLPSTEQDSKSKDEKSTIEKEKRTLQGRWIVIKAELGGKRFGPLEEAFFSFEGDTLVRVTEYLDMEIVTLRLDPAKNPKQIDFIPKKGGEKEKTQGIYQLAGDTLKLCMAAKHSPFKAEGTAAKGQVGELASATVVFGKERPKQFDSKQGFLLTLKRANEKLSQYSPEGPGRPLAGSLQGTKIVSKENSRPPATNDVAAPKQETRVDLRPDIGIFAGDRFARLSNKSVQEELKLTDGQKADLRTASATLKEKLLAELDKNQKQDLALPVLSANMVALGASPPGTTLCSLVASLITGRAQDLTRAEKTLKIMDSIEKESDKVATDLLQPNQAKRFQQIKWQDSGLRVFQDPDIQTALKLEKDQKSQIDKILEDNFKQVQKLNLLGDQTNLEEAAKKVVTLRKDAEKNLYGVLTEEQKRAFKTLLGPPFKVKR